MTRTTGNEGDESECRWGVVIKGGVPAFAGRGATPAKSLHFFAFLRFILLISTSI